MSNNSNYTYMWQMQQYKPSKGFSRIEISPSNARPLTNGTWNNNQMNDTIDGNAFLPRPIKNWRKQLQPDNVRGGSKSNLIREAFQPGGTIYLNGKVDEVNSCCEIDNITTKLHSYITIEKNNRFCKNTDLDLDLNLNLDLNCSYTITAENVSNGWKGPIGKKICCNPEYNIIKSASTLLKKTYYTDSKAYLKSRNKLYNQKLSTLPYPGITYIENGKWLYPNDNDELGPEVFSTGYCQENVCGSSPQITIFKPSNRTFKVQGAVSSSTRVEKLKLDAVNKSAKSLTIPYGKSAAKAGSYYLNGNTPYLIKDKIGKCDHHHKKGNFTKCFHTNTSSIFTNNRRITTISPYMYHPSLSS